MRAVFDQLLTDEVLPSRMPDVALLRGYLERGCPHGDPICLSFGETWSQVPRELAARVRDQPTHAHGYQLSQHGLPALRRVLRDYIVRTHEVPTDSGVDLDVAVTWSGTRAAMFDYARMVRAASDDARMPVAICAAPAWDYAGVLEPLGFRMRYLHLRPEQGFAPDAEALRALIADIERTPGERLALVVINAQHNPTALNWSEAFVRAALEAALDAGAHLLLDDAYFGVHDEGVVPTSALRILCELLPGRATADGRRWLAVRSLGKQFHCNGWGVGAITAHPETLDLLVNRYRLQHTLMYGGVMQHAMADWLVAPEADAFLRSQQRSYREKRRRVGNYLGHHLGYPAESLHLGECTSYLFFAVPSIYRGRQGGVERFLAGCFARTGVLLAPSWPWPFADGAVARMDHVRMFLGPASELVLEALDRLRAAGFHHDMAVETPHLYLGSHLDATSARASTRSARDGIHPRGPCP